MMATYLLTKTFDKSDHEVNACIAAEADSRPSGYLEFFGARHIVRVNLAKRHCPIEIALHTLHLICEPVEPDCRG